MHACIMLWLHLSKVKGFSDGIRQKYAAKFVDSDDVNVFAAKTSYRVLDQHHQDVDEYVYT